MSEVATQTLHIVARELNVELNDARAALENFGEQQDDIRFLENCRERLHLVHGALRVAEVHGAALLAEEMEQVANYLISNFAEKRHLAEGLDALMRAMVQLPTYLERVLGGGRDMALILLPLLNDLRAVRGHALLSEGTLLLLNLTSEKQANPLPLLPGEHLLPVANWARKLRPRFQLGLLGWIKGERIEQNLDVLARTAEKIEQVATTQSVFQLWWVIGAAIEALREGGLEGSASLKRLLGHADREMRRLYEQGEQQYAERPPVELLNNLLYYLARATVAGPRVAAVRASFRLGELLPVDQHVEAARENLAAPSIKLMKTVAAAIKEDLGKVKDALDIFVRKNDTQAGELTPQLDLLRKIGDTLGVLGLGELRDRVQAEIGALQAVIESHSPVTEALLMRVASTLINIEDGLDEQLVGLILPNQNDAATPGSDDVEFRQVSEAVLRECIVNMARIKEAIALSVEKPREAQVLDQVPALIRGITAGLLMLGKTRAVDLAVAIGNELSRHINGVKSGVSHEAMDRLADAIVAVEYYMETLHAGRTDPWYMLDNAEACLQALSELAVGTTSDLQNLREVGDYANTIAVEPAVGARTMVLDRNDRAAATLANTAQLTMVIPSQQAVKNASQTRAEQHKSSAPSAPLPLPLKVDAEFIELFIEEARDEITKLEQLFPQWDENPQNSEALNNIRRSFHTLKGSGRMVGAQAVGDLAWAVETMLNRVINKTLERTPDMMALMRRAVAALPELVEQLESGRAPVIDVSALIAEANAIALVRDMQASRRISDQELESPANTGGQEKKTTLEADQSPTIRSPLSPSVAASLAVKQKLDNDSLSDSSHQAAAPHSQLRTPPKAIVSPILSRVKDTAPLMDAVLQDIFSKETAGHLAAIRDYLASCALLTAPFPVTDTLHRACHTLSGTAKTAGALQGIKITDPLNHYVRKLYDNGIGLPAAGMQVLRDSVRAIENVIEHINENTGYFLTHSSIIERIAKLEQALDNELTSIAAAITAETPAPKLDAFSESWENRQTNANASDGDDDDVIELSFEASEENEELGLGATRMGRGLQESDVIEVSIDATSIQEKFAAASPASIDVDVTVNVERSNVVDLLAVDDAEIEFPSELLDDAESLDETAHTPASIETAAWAAHEKPSSLEVESSTITVMDVTQAVPVLDTPVPALVPASKAPPSIVKAAALEEEGMDEEFDADVAAIFTEEAAELLDVADASLASWTQDRANKSMMFELKRALHTLKGGARMAGIRAMGNLSHELESLMEDVESGKVVAEQNVLNLLQESLDELHRMRDVVNSGRPVAGAHDLLARIQVASGAAPAPVIPQEHAVRKQANTPTAISDANRGYDAHSELEPITILSGLEADDINIEEAEFHPDELDPASASDATLEINAAAADQSSELIDELNQHLLDSAPLRTPVADFEKPFGNTLTQAIDDASSEIIIESVDLSDNGDDQVDIPADSNAHAAVEIADIAAPALALPGRDMAQPERGEVARVDAELLDVLLNNAGEVSILRSRLEQQVNSIDFNLAELGRTVIRLKDQLRKLELETEAQILHGHHEGKAGRTDFDPLELDRYSTIQQLSRALAESVSDVASIEGLLGSMTREAQNLLVQQSRMVTEVQNGLMRTRMVPFSRHVQRLSRIVRQVASETSKRADLAVSGASGELDRQVLERMLPPLEHMLRNSVVHGIESPEERTAAGKSETGTIRISLQREGSEMMIVVEDDGRGIDVRAVRERARARGILAPGRSLTDEEALQLVLEPGFSTATTVTQHAGRGVGMDVVVAEIKKLGGALFTKSTPGHGVRFTIRLPFTLAISQALIVRIGEETYALPLPTVEGVARVPRLDVMRHLAEAESTFKYGTQIYHFQHLGAFIDAPPSTLPDADVPVPVILINAGEHSTGLVVDELVGNREIVVKPVGPQVAAIRGVAGATILGDGRIVIILDMGALVRSGWRGRTEVAAPTEDRRAFALVVDDSITVRRVTQRLLERNGMRVATAKDGIDALEVMQEHIPDIILLDIEMPRMDGYELAGHVRKDPRLAGIPIIMITSRVGEKHRARAIELGVNDYLGKPYQENQLLDAIEPLIEASRRRAAATLASKAS